MRNIVEEKTISLLQKNQHESQNQALESKLRQSESKTLQTLDKSQIILLIQQHAPQSTYDEKNVYDKLTQMIDAKIDDKFIKFAKQ